MSESPPVDPLLLLIHGFQVCLNKNDYDLRRSDPYHTGDVDFDDYEYGLSNDGRDSAALHPCLGLKRILSGRTFYYSTTFDLTNCLQDR